MDDEPDPATRVQKSYACSRYGCPAQDISFPDLLSLRRHSARAHPLQSTSDQYGHPTGYNTMFSGLRIEDIVAVTPAIRAGGSMTQWELPIAQASPLPGLANRDITVFYARCPTPKLTSPDQLDKPPSRDREKSEGD